MLMQLLAVTRCTTSVPYARMFHINIITGLDKVVGDDPARQVGHQFRLSFEIGGPTRGTPVFISYQELWAPLLLYFDEKTNCSYFMLLFVYTTPNHGSHSGNPGKVRHQSWQMRGILESLLLSVLSSKGGTMYAYLLSHLNGLLFRSTNPYCWI